MDNPSRRRSQFAPAPHVAVIVVNWNGKAMTLDCLRSLAAVDYPSLHIIVVDNGSHDGSVEAISREWPGVEVISLPANLRFAGGNNAGIHRALEQGADQVMLLNNDTLVDPQSVEMLVRRMNATPACGAVSPKIYYHDRPDVIWFAGGAISFWQGSMWHRGIREKDNGQRETPGRMEYATGCCVMVRSDVIRKVGVLDEAYFIYGEDADWSFRIRNAGYELWYEPAAKIWHRLSVSAGGHLSWFKLRHKYASTLRFMARYASWYHWLVFPWLHPLSIAWTTGRYFFGRKE